MVDLYTNISSKTSQLITRKYSTSFSTAVRMLSPKVRHAIYNIYGFVRIADEIVDTFLDYDQELIFDEFTNNLHLALSQGMSPNPILHSFVQTVNEYNISRKHIDAFMKSMRADLSKNAYLSEAETDEYIYGSAKVVGLMCLRVFVNGNEQLYQQLESSAMDLGSAFQKVNFLRDLKADYEELDRTYFHEYNKTTFNEEVKLKIIHDIENDFTRARKGIKQLPGQSKLAVWLAYSYYYKLLRKIKNTPAKEIIGSRIRVNNVMKVFILNKAYIKYKMNLI